MNNAKNFKNVREVSLTEVTRAYPEFKVRETTRLDGDVGYEITIPECQVRNFGYPSRCAKAHISIPNTVIQGTHGCVLWPMRTENVWPVPYGADALRRIATEVLGDKWLEYQCGILPGCCYFSDRENVHFETKLYPYTEEADSILFYSNANLTWWGGLHNLTHFSISEDGYDYLHGVVIPLEFLTKADGLFPGYGISRLREEMEESLKRFLDVA